MAALQRIVLFLDNLLKPREFQDSSLNGVQVASPQTSVSRVAVAVDSGKSVIEQAIAAQAQLLIVHHGLLWGAEQAIVGPFGEKINLLQQNGCTLYASHLPLDAHPTFGNNVLLAKHYGLEVDGTFAEIGGKAIGIKARAKNPTSLEFFVKQSASLSGAHKPLVLPFGVSQISTVGVLSGSGASVIGAAAGLGLDLLISGEPKQHAYHDCKDLHLNALFAGHYATETLGVCALGDLLAREFGITSIFIDEPTGI